jgi:phosphoribosyl-ATP pyrophosphohydrolase
MGLSFDAVLDELERREGVSGLTEKAARSGVSLPQQGD